ncbi:hypothetical protein pEaSNUABM25_00239 [Erwinia phage pEa_SNUABM_25]|nr:hypothetical protein pEaSNUABM25_00239 [Erwinia phage pEa_SNUABM_25]
MNTVYLPSLIDALNNCRFYAANMINIQFNMRLEACPPEHPEVPEEDHQLLVARIAQEFDNAVSRTDLRWDAKPLIHRFRALHSQYLTAVGGELQFDRIPELSYPIPFPFTENTPPDQEIARRHLRFTGEQVRAYQYMVCLSRYTHKEETYYLPSPPDQFEMPDVDAALPFDSAQSQIAGIFLEHYQRVEPPRYREQALLEEVGREKMLPMISQCRFWIYKAFPTVLKKVETND